MSLDCCVCLEQCDWWISPCCGQSIHLACVVQSIGHGNLNCPLCRYDLSDACVLSLVIGRLGARLGDLNEIMRLLDHMDNSVDKVKYFICKTATDNWILSLVMWCSDETGFCKVKDIWIRHSMDVIEGIPNLTLTLVESSIPRLPNGCEVLPNYFGAMHSRGKSYVVERKSCSGSPPVDIVTGLSQDPMLCMSALDPAHSPFLQFAANSELMALVLKLSSHPGGEEFLKCPRKFFELDLMDGRYTVVVAQLTVEDLQQVLIYAKQLGITRLPTIDGYLCSWCTTSGAKRRCAKCKMAYYCNKTCQRAHWKDGHKINCS